MLFIGNCINTTVGHAGINLTTGSNGNNLLCIVREPDEHECICRGSPPTNSNFRNAFRSNCFKSNDACIAVVGVRCRATKCEGTNFVDFLPVVLFRAGTRVRNLHIGLHPQQKISLRIKKDLVYRIVVQFKLNEPSFAKVCVEGSITKQSSLHQSLNGLTFDGATLMKGNI